MSSAGATALPRKKPITATSLTFHPYPTRVCDRGNQQETACGCLGDQLGNAQDPRAPRRSAVTAAGARMRFGTIRCSMSMAATSTSIDTNTSPGQTRPGRPPSARRRRTATRSAPRRAGNGPKSTRHSFGSGRGASATTGSGRCRSWRSGCHTQGRNAGARPTGEAEVSGNVQKLPTAAPSMASRTIAGAVRSI